MMIQGCLKKGFRFFLRGDVNKIAQLQLRYLKLFTTEQLSDFQSNLVQIINEIQVSSNEGPDGFPRRDTKKNSKIYHRKFKKSSSPKPLG